MTTGKHKQNVNSIGVLELFRKSENQLLQDTVVKCPVPSTLSMCREKTYLLPNHPPRKATPTIHIEEMQGIYAVEVCRKQVVLACVQPLTPASDSILYDKVCTKQNCSAKCLITLEIVIRTDAILFTKKCIRSLEKIHHFEIQLLIHSFWFQ